MGNMPGAHPNDPESIVLRKVDSLARGFEHFGESRDNANCNWDGWTKENETQWYAQYSVPWEVGEPHPELSDR